MTSQPRKAGSLFSGAGGLDLAVEAVFGAETRWVSDIIARDKHGRQIGDAPRILAHRFPGIPNLGDITTVDWAGVERVDIIAGGSPCQDVSAAGKRAGMTEGTRSNLWVAMRDAIAYLQPAYVIWENVRGSLTARADSALESDPRLLGDHQPGVLVLRAAGRVLGDLADLGFDAAWCVLPAAAVGAPHGRNRIFVVAAHPERVARLQWGVATPGQAPVRWPLGTTSRRGGASGLGLLPTPRASRGASDTETVALLPTPVTTDGKSHSAGDLRRKNPGLRSVCQLLPTPTAADSKASGAHGYNGNEFCTLTDATVRLPQQWGKHAAAIARWEQLTRPAPAPTIPGKNGRPRLNPQFSEWMMGWPAGWVTDVPGMRDPWKHHAIGNGVVPQQAAAAIRWCLAQLAQ